MRKARILVTIGVLAAAFLMAASAASSLSGGITRSDGLTEEGCICHGPNQADDGTADGNVVVQFRMEGLAGNYQPGESYNLTVGASDTDVPVSEDGNKGGFNLLVNLGTLEVPDGWTDFVEVSEGAQGFEATHTVQGDQNGRTFNLTWTAPSADDGPAVFTLFVNTVNGDGSNNEADHWNKKIVVVPGPDGSVSLGAGGENPAEIGVRWFAHWVGLISFAAVVVTLVMYYFVLKYSESIHTTDHRDRQGK